MSLLGPRSKQRAFTPLVTTVASTKKRKAADQVEADNKPALKKLTPVAPSTTSVTTTMSSDDEFMSDQLSDDQYEDDDYSLGELGTS